MNTLKKYMCTINVNCGYSGRLLVTIKYYLKDKNEFTFVTKRCHFIYFFKEIVLKIF